MRLKKFTCILISILFSLIVITQPVFASESLKMSEPVKRGLEYNELIGKVKDVLTEKALNNKSVKLLLDELSIGSVKVLSSDAYEWNYGGKSGEVIIMTLDAPKETQIGYAVNDDIVKLGASVKIDEKTIETYDVIDEKIYNTSTIELNDNNEPNIIWKEGPIADYAKDIANQDVGIRSSDCETCLDVCNYLYGGGCAFSAFIACNIACAPFAGLACPAICAVIFGIICTFGSSNSCPVICSDEGYCN